MWQCVTLFQRVWHDCEVNNQATKAALTQTVLGW